MSFKRSANQSERWSAFLEENAAAVARLSRVASQLATADRFDDFLQRGVSDVGHSLITLSALSELEWAFFRSVVDQYSREWQSYFHPLMYAGYHAELDRRTWIPSTLPMTDDDMRKPHVVIHFWAPWNIYDREFDDNIRLITQRLRNDVAFRSMNVDLPSCANAFTLDDVLTVPSLAFYNVGKRHHTTVGVRPTAEIEREIKEWLAHTGSR